MGTNTKRKTTMAKLKDRSRAPPSALHRGRAYCRSSAGVNLPGGMVLAGSNRVRTGGIDRRRGWGCGCRGAVEQRAAYSNDTRAPTARRRATMQAATTALAAASVERQDLAARQSAQIVELLEQNTALTKLTQELSARIEALTAEMHRTLCHQ